MTSLHRDAGRSQARRGPGRGTVLALALALCACATSRAALDRPEGDGAARGASSGELARAGLGALVLRSDAATAERRFAEAVRRDGKDPWARYGSALAARRRLDDDAEVAHLTALIAGAPAHPLVPVAARRLGDLARYSPALAQAIEAGLAPVQPRLGGLAALRVRSARAAAAAALGEVQRASRLRAEDGALTSSSLAGPFGALHALDLDTRFAPEEGAIPASVPSPAGLPEVPSRPLATPDGAVLLDGEPAQGELHYLAAEVTLAEGGDYLLAIAGAVSMRAFLDGAPVAERRAHAGFLPLAQVVPLRLAAGKHRLLLKVAQGEGRPHLAVSLARADGAPSDAAFAPTAPGSPSAPVRARALPPPLPGPAELAQVLEAEAGPVIARLVAAQDAADVDREAAKALAEEALARAPRSAALLALRAELRQDDPTLAERIARSRAAADLDLALAADPGHAAARLARASLARAGDRLDDAAALLDRLSEVDAARPRALLARARLAQARGLVESAERFAEEARRRDGGCAALSLLHDLASQRDAVARQDELVAALARCPGGRERLVTHRRRRGDLRGALALASEIVLADPPRLDARLVRADLLAASGDPRAAADDLAELARTWPRDPRLPRRRAEYLDDAGDAKGARAARELALLLDASDLGLRRALAVEDGREPLDELDEDGARALAAYRESGSHRATSSVTVLDLGAIEVHPGGAYTERIHSVVEARDERAVDRLGEVSVPEGAQLIEARTVKKDGRVLEPEQPLGDKRTLSLTGLEPGDFAEWVWLRTVPARGPAVPGFTADAFYFQADEPLWRSVYAAAAPKGLDLSVDAHHLPAPEVKEEGGRQVVRVVREDVPPVLPEPNAPAEAEHLPFVQVGTGAGTEALARAIADGALEPCRPSLEVRALAAEIAASVPEARRGTDALPRAAYRRVHELILGQGGPFSEPAGAVLSRSRGSRTVLLKSVLDALGVRSRLALVRDFGRDPAPYRFARPDLYAYAVLRVQHGGAVAWLDPTTRGAPYGSLPAALRDAEAVVLPAPGERVEVTRTPPDDGSERRRTRLVIAVDGEGNATVEGAEDYRGVEAAGLRNSIEKLDAPSRRQAMEQSLARTFRSPSLLDLAVEGEAALEAPITLRWRARVEGWARLEEGRAVVEAPLFPARLGARFLQRAARERPLLLAGDERSTTELTISLPPGWMPAPVEPPTVTSAYGSYRREERGEAGRLLRTDTYDLRRGRVAPGDYPAFASFARAVDAAQDEPMVFLRATPGEKTPARPLAQTPGT
jgi:cellulose synthase operon protein C